MNLVVNLDELKFFDDNTGCVTDIGEKIIDEIVVRVVDDIYDDVYKTVKGKIQSALEHDLKGSMPEIKKDIVESVAEKVAKKKAIMEITPKAKDLRIDSENVKYFEGLVDRAIAKRFKNVI